MFLKFQSHKAVSRRKQSDFGRWHSKWIKSNVSESSQTSIQDWFMGKCEGLVPNKTIKLTKADLDHTPYRTFYKYKAEIVKTSNGPSADASANAPSSAVQSAPVSASAGSGSTASMPASAPAGASASS